MVPRSSKNLSGSLLYSELASLPLPGPAVVIDVRSTKSYDPPLIQYLMTEVEDLTTQMRLHKVTRWRFLSKCMEFISLDLPVDKTVANSTRFTLTRGDEEKTFETKDALISHLHREYVDLVRTNRISAARDTHNSAKGFSAAEVELEQSTVRVFFLIDASDASSLTSAAEYAKLLRQKKENSNPLRSGYDERLNLIAICINADDVHFSQLESEYDDQESDESGKPFSVIVEQEQTAPAPTTHITKRWQGDITTRLTIAFDVIIPIYAYRDDEGFVANDTQTYELELILYALLLSPESLAVTSQEMRDDRADRYLALEDSADKQASFPSGEICLPGIASIEYSTSWARHWFNYGLVMKSLQTLRETEAITNENDLRLYDGRDWLDSWWAEVRVAIPGRLLNAIPGFKGLFEFQRRISASAFHNVTLPDSQVALQDFCRELESYYVGTGSVTLQQAIMSTEHVKQLLEETPEKPYELSAEQSSQEQEALKTLGELQQQTSLFATSLFQGAFGALPRAINQVEALGIRIEEGEVGRYTRKLPNVVQQQEQFAVAAVKADMQMASLLKTWQLPFFGRVQRSTPLSLLVFALIALCGWLLQDSLTFLPSVLTYSLPVHGGISLFRVLIVIIVGVAGFFYLSTRNKRLLERRNSIVQFLYQTANAHLTEVQMAIAARVAIMLLEKAGLYRSDGKTAQYKQRLSALDTLLTEAQKQATTYQREAYERIKLGLNQTKPARPSNRIWLHLNSRKDLFPWERSIETFQQLGEGMTKANGPLEMLAKSLLRLLAPEKQPVAFTDVQTKPFYASEEQFQSVSSELVATLLVTEIVGSSIITLQPLLDRYLSLDLYDQYAPSLFGEHIAELYDVLKAMKLEQAMSSSTDSLLQQEFLDRAIVQPKWTSEQILAAWIENFYATNEQANNLLNHNNIIELLQEAQIKLSVVLQDLSSRCRLLGYRDELANGQDSYVLLMPGSDSQHERYEALATLQPTQIRLLSFPDQEKLIYFHLYRVQPGS